MAAKKKGSPAQGKKSSPTNVKQKTEKPAAMKGAKPVPKAEARPAKGKKPTPEEHIVLPKEEERLTISDDSIITLSELSKPLAGKETLARIAPKRQQKETSPKQVESPPEPEPEAPPEEAAEERTETHRAKLKKAEPKEEEPEGVLTEEQLAVLESAPKPIKAAEVEKVLEPKRKPLPPPPSPPRAPPAVEKPKAPPVSPLKRLKEKVGLEPAPGVEEEEPLEVQPTEVTRRLPIAIEEKPALVPEEERQPKKKQKKVAGAELPPPLPVGAAPEVPAKPGEPAMDRKRLEQLRHEAEHELKKLVKEKGYVPARKARALKYEVAELERKLKIMKGEPVPESPEVEAPPKTLLGALVDFIRHEPTSSELEEHEEIKKEAQRQAGRLVKELGYIQQKEAGVLEEKAAELRERLKAAEAERLAKLREEEERRKAAELRAAEEERRRLEEERMKKEEAVPQLPPAVERQERKPSVEEMPAPPLPEPEETFPSLIKEEELPPPPLPEQEEPAKKRRRQKGKEERPPLLLPEGEIPTKQEPGEVPEEAKPEHLKEIESLWTESEKLWDELQAVPEKEKKLIAKLDEGFVKRPLRQRKQVKLEIPSDVLSEEEELQKMLEAEKAKETKPEEKTKGKKQPVLKPEPLSEEIASLKKAVTSAVPPPPEEEPPENEAQSKVKKLPAVPAPGPEAAQPSPKAPKPAKAKSSELSLEDLELPPPPKQGEVVPPALFEVPDIAPPPGVMLKKKPTLPKESRAAKEVRIERIAGEFKELDKKLESISSKFAEAEGEVAMIKQKRPGKKESKKAPARAGKDEEQLEAESLKWRLDEEQRQHGEEIRERIAELANDMRRMLAGGQLNAAEDAFLRIRRHREQMGKARLGPLEYELKLLEADLKLARLR